MKRFGKLLKAIEYNDFRYKFLVESNKKLRERNGYFKEDNVKIHGSFAVLFLKLVFLWKTFVCCLSLSSLFAWLEFLSLTVTKLSRRPLTEKVWISLKV